ncbi:MAG TPA: flavin reductase family protein [Candidatus Acidoferrum sp.]|jgi:flavin reductase (DIM6/NTAB) family NADH-FMN oxidoreductase RutF
MSSTTLNPQLFRRVVGHFATGITVITVEREPGLVHGMTANSFTSVSLDPLLILICVDHNARLLSFLEVQGRFGVNILKDNQQSVSEYFAKPLQDYQANERSGIRFRWTDGGIPLLEDSLAYLACNVVAKHPAGDHTLFLAEVETMDVGEGNPLLYHMGKYRRLES